MIRTAMLVLLLTSNVLALWRAAHWRKAATPVAERSAGTPTPRGLEIHPLPGLGRRNIADLRPGDEILVWAHERSSPLEPEHDGELWKHGVVDHVVPSPNPRAWRSVTIVFRTGRRVYAMPEAKTFVVGKHHVTCAPTPSSAASAWR